MRPKKETFTLKMFDGRKLRRISPTSNHFNNSVATFLILRIKFLMINVMIASTVQNSIA